MTEIARTEIAALPASEPDKPARRGVPRVVITSLSVAALIVLWEIFDGRSTCFRFLRRSRSLSVGPFRRANR
jgi:hypothetical protein